MLTQKKLNEGKKGRSATGSGDVIGLRLQPDLEKALKDWMKAQNELSLSKQAAIRRLLRGALAEKGFLGEARERDGQ
jgi:hypothetical protein